MVEYDLGVAWNWQFDADFIALLESRCLTKGLSILQITPGNLGEILHSLATQEIKCRAFFDRASDEDSQFLPLVQWMHENRVFGINSRERALLTWDKAEMHSLMVAVGVDVPHTIILPSFFDQPELPCIDFLSLAEQFTLKPAHGGGGVGVVTNVTSWEQVISVRQEHATDRYLLQAQITPQNLETRPAWFRIIYCAGRAFSCWWHPSTHVYTPVTVEEKDTHDLHILDEIAISISRLCGLELFSTEIAISPEGCFKVVDYVNDQIDLRLQSAFHDGVPDSIVYEIADRLVNQLSTHT